jgi:hypothetical protein
MVRGLALFGLQALASCNALVGFSGLQRVDSTTADPNTDDDAGDAGPVKRSNDGGRTEEDGGPTQPRCDKTKPFGPGVSLGTTINSTGHETTPTLTADELTIIFQRGSFVDGGDLLIATRTSRDQPFGAPRLLTELNGNGVDCSPTITADGLVLFWVELNKNVNPFSNDVFTASRATPNALFTNRRALDEVNSPDDEEFDTFISADGTELWFTRHRPPATAVGVFRSLRSRTTNEFTTPVAMSTPSLDGPFAFSPDMLTVYTSDLAPTGGSTNYDLVSLHRTSLTAAFGARTSLGEPNSTPHFDEAPWISPDECRIYFSSSRTVNDDLFYAERGR